jgi:hypothetical protein
MWEWIFGVTLITLYIFFIFTICRLTFAKGYTILGVVGIFMPILWLIGAILPAKPGSLHDVAEAARYQQRMGTMTR